MIATASPLDAMSDAAECARITMAHARTFSLASKLLPTDKRRAAYALYAFCRVADDLVDQADHGHLAALRVQLDAYRNELAAALDGRPSGPIFRELAWVTRRYGVAADPLFELLDGVGRDLEAHKYETWGELEQYCEGVASSVGEMCTYVFGVPAGPSMRTQAIRYARTLGTAMQLTNILRDVGEDAQRGRCYLPAEDMARFGLTPEDVLSRGAAVVREPGWSCLMAFEVSRARALYAAAMPGITLLDPDAQRCAAACANGYAGILVAIENQGYDTISSRARIGRMARVGILWNAWRYRAPEPDLSALGHGPRIVWEPNAVSASVSAGVEPRVRLA
jgi:phytoene synthase